MQVKWLRILYSDFSAFTRVQERLISMANDLRVDFLEGQLMMSNGIVDTSFFPLSDQTRVASLVNEHRIIYVLEVAKYYDDPTVPTTGQVQTNFTYSFYAHITYYKKFKRIITVTYYHIIVKAWHHHFGFICQKIRVHWMLNFVTEMQGRQ